MTYAVVFVSRTGNTRRLAETILPASGHPDEADLQALACAAAQAWQKAGQDG